MDSNYKLKELRIKIKEGVELIAEVNNISDINQLLEDLKKTNLQFQIEVPKEKRENPPGGEQNLNDPISKIEIQADLEQNSLIGKKILAFKDSIPQLLRPSVFNNITDGLLVLLYSVEIGLNKRSIEYDAFKSLFESQNLKSGSSLSMLLNNLKNAQYIDRSSYEKDRTIMLSPKGAQKSIEILGNVIKK